MIELYYRLKTFFVEDKLFSGFVLGMVLYLVVLLALFIRCW